MWWKNDFRYDGLQHYTFRTAFRAGIRLDAYQLEPLRKALLLPRVNLFIADWRK